MRRSCWIVFLPVLPQLAFAYTYPNCLGGWEWSYNTLGQNPCAVFAYLAGQGDNLGILPLASGTEYNYPSADGANLTAQCNTVSYSLISACGACQGCSYMTWSQWTLGCPAIPPDGTYPLPISNGTRVPYWAHLLVMKADTWNATLAKSAGDSPEVTPTPVSSFQPSSTSSVISQSLPSSSSSNQDKPHANHGHIAGAIVGGVISSVLLIAMIFWYFRRRLRLTQSSRSPLVGSAAPIAEVADLPDPDTSTPMGMYYDPSDPSTFPPPVIMPQKSAIEAMPGNNSGRNPESVGTRDKTQYNGLPLV
ncbi:hypothetical protein F5148DRAFT_370373 [Russula earlei]|uniref:Uncharacterized protein n=1 Tax=Russula earlei TaxID=71964 RepID=A0ACC0U202_9AGAM|nr:hypothetical protein F5148DRAFT_370373 [Russula earlei]